MQIRYCRILDSHSYMRTKSIIEELLVDINVLVNGDKAHDMMSGRSITGLLAFVNSGTILLKLLFVFVDYVLFGQ